MLWKCIYYFNTTFDKWIYHFSLKYVKNSFCLDITFTKDFLPPEIDYLRFERHWRVFSSLRRNTRLVYKIRGRIFVVETCEQAFFSTFLVYFSSFRDNRRKSFKQSVYLFLTVSDLFWYYWLQMLFYDIQTR